MLHSATSAAGAATGVLLGQHPSHGSTRRSCGCLAEKGSSRVGHGQSRRLLAGTRGSNVDAERQGEREGELGHLANELIAVLKEEKDAGEG